MKNDFSIMDFFKEFPTEEAAREYFENIRWKDGIRCPYCGKSVAPLKFFGSPKLACPRCGRIYRYEE